MSYTPSLNFEWDEYKSDVCFAERGFDFAYVTRTFVDPNRIIKKHTRWNYGEERYQLLGVIDQREFFVAYTLRGSTIRIISARKANQREINNYENNQSKY
jgi:uncharacterized DUF497 family protein